MADADDAQAQVITSLRTQVQDLFTQVTQLNTKLVQSYDRVSDLEDDLHVASSNLRTATLKVSELEIERTQHAQALNTGLLVEKSQVTTELNRLMEKATEEAAQRGQAESARQQIEKELDDLAASLFDQANTMVAEARLSQSRSERKVTDAESALKGAEEAVKLMQEQMQQLQAQRSAAVPNAPILRKDLRLLSTHVPYQEFLLFVAHLRSLHTSSVVSPSMSTLLPLPFLARLLAEDSEPTLRLDLAPSLNWLSRRSVLSAIHNNQLSIEPISPLSLFTPNSSSASTSTPSYLLSTASLLNPGTIPSSSPSIAPPPGYNASTNSVSCALCGATIFVLPEAYSRNHQHSPNPLSSLSISGNSWSTALFKNSRSANNGSSHPSPPPTPPAVPISQDQVQIQDLGLPSQMHIFRLSSSSAPSTTVPQIRNPASPSPPAPSATNLTPYASSPSSPAPGSSSTATIYPLCTSGWCLERLRTTCSLYAFIRAGIVDKVWEEEVPVLPPPSNLASLGRSSSNNSTNRSLTDKPSIPPRKRGLWGMASKLGERAASWTGDISSSQSSDKKEKEKEKEQERERKLPPPPPPQQSENSDHSSTAPAPAPPIAPAPAPKVEADKETDNVSRTAPPPLPRRSQGRSKTQELSSPTKATHSEGPPPIVTSTEPEPPVVHSPTPIRSPAQTLIQEDSSAFVTPAEEIGDPVAATNTTSAAEEESQVVSPKAQIQERSSTPTSTPLPDSVPGTPSPSTKFRVPADIASRTGSPVAPPPVPRRASGRANRPTSLAMSAPLGPRPQPGSRPITPVVTPELDKDKKEETTEENSEAKEKEDIKDETAEVKEREESKDENSEVKEKGEQVEKEEEDKKESAPAPIPDQNTDIGAGVGANPEAINIESQDTSKDNLEKANEESDTPATSNVADSQVEEAKADDKTDAPPTSTAPLQTESPESTSEPTSPIEFAPVGGNGEQTKTPTKASMQDTNEAETSEQKENDGDDVNYVGDVTWEERTWKQVVKLREDMLWARIGGVR